MEGPRVIYPLRRPFHSPTLADLQESLVFARATLEVANYEVVRLHAR